MPLPPVLQNLPLPIIGSPLFIISTPKLVIEQCKAGVVGSMPSLNARPAEQLGWPGIERRHGADDAGLALRDHQLGVADDEQGRTDDGQRQLLQDLGECHRAAPDQNASRARAVTLSAPSTMASRVPPARLRMCSA